MILQSRSQVPPRAQAARQPESVAAAGGRLPGDLQHRRFRAADRCVGGVFTETFNSKTVPVQETMRRVILHTTQSPGDVVMLTAAVRDLKGRWGRGWRSCADAVPGPVGAESASDAAGGWRGEVDSYWRGACPAVDSTIASRSAQLVTSLRRRTAVPSKSPHFPHCAASYSLRSPAPVRARPDAARSRAMRCGSAL